VAQIENEVYAVLSGTGAITALVSTRIFPAFMPQAVSAFPAIVYTKTGGSRISHLGGYSGLQNSDIEINIYAERTTTLQAVSTVVLAAMDASTAFDSWALDDPFDGYDDDIELKTRTLSFSIWNQG